MGSLKSQVGAALLIPLLALGVPLFDTMLSPLRRFVRGRNMFSPDSGHIHHRLINMGLTTKKAVLIIYLMTFSLCLSGVILVNIRNEQTGLFLIVLGAGAIVFIRKLGYFEYIASDKVYGWFRDFADETGLSRGRRGFLSLQIDMGRATDFDDLWAIFCRAMEMLDIDQARLDLDLGLNADGTDGAHHHSMRWRQDDFPGRAEIDSDHLFKLELPLLGKELKSYGTMQLIKNLKRKPVYHYTFRRVEQLRRSFIAALDVIAKRESS